MKYTKIFGTSLVAMFVLSAFLMATPFVMAGNGEKGNGAPSGAHWNLNIIGMPRDKNIDPLNYTNMGHRIFVDLRGTTQIQLLPGEDFRVVDYDGTDGKAALQLMDPWTQTGDLINMTSDDAVYKVFIRVLGKPGGSINITSYYVDENGTQWWSLDSVEITRVKGQMKFQDRTLDLTTIRCDVDGDGIPERIGLFDPMFESFFWNYDNKGVKLCQMRFYLNPTS